MVENRNQKKTTSVEEINAQYGKLPPQAVDVEKAVLGALMLEQDAIHKLNGIIDTEYFYKEEHKIIFKAIKDLSKDNKPIDLLTVTRILHERGEFDSIGGPVYVTKLTSKVASAAHIEFHSRIIAQKFIQRELIRISSEIQTESYDETVDVEDLLSNARSKISDVDALISTNNSGQMSSVVASEALKELEQDYANVQAGISPGITTGLFDLNRALGGWRDSNLIILAARPSVGKTSLALNFAKIAAQTGKWVNFYGLEMKNQDLYRILLSAETGIDRTSLRDGALNDADWESINKATQRLEKLPVIWNDFAGISAGQIKSATIKNRKAGKCDLIIIDYLQLIRPTDRKAIREQQVAEISRTLKEIALSEGIPIICLSQLNRDVERRSDKRPTLADIRESGAIEQDADVILFLYEQEKKLMLTIGKNRRGKTGDIDFWSNDERTKFLDREPTYFDDKVPVAVDMSAGFTPNEDFENEEPPF